LQLIQRPAQGLQIPEILTALTLHLIQEPLGLFHLLHGLLERLDDLLNMAVCGLDCLPVVARALRLGAPTGWAGRRSLAAVRTWLRGGARRCRQLCCFDRRGTGRLTVC
jgi:hypothetical protein